jgi:hypothetical protein
MDWSTDDNPERRLLSPSNLPSPREAEYLVRLLTCDLKALNYIEFGRGFVAIPLECVLLWLLRVRNDQSSEGPFGCTLHGVKNEATKATVQSIRCTKLDVDATRIEGDWSHLIPTAAVVEKS